MIKKIKRSPLEGIGIVWPCPDLIGLKPGVNPTQPWASCKRGGWAHMVPREREGPRQRDFSSQLLLCKFGVCIWYTVHTVYCTVQYFLNHIMYGSIKLSLNQEKNQIMTFFCKTIERFRMTAQNNQLFAQCCEDFQRHWRLLEAVGGYWRLLEASLGR